MFDSLLGRLDGVFNRLRGKGRISEANTREAMREIRTALLEADVHYKVAREFTASVQERALGEDVIKSVSPGQQIVKIFNDELVKLMGPVDHKIPMESDRPTVIMLSGLQGSGKTTTAAKLARYLEKQGHRPLMVAADVQRPAAVEQLRMLGDQLDIPVYLEKNGKPVQICSRALDHAKKNDRDIVILDTAGRLHVDEDLMMELKMIAGKTKPTQTYFVCDAMTGQDAVNSASAFNERLEIDGVILTKLDGDARGGAALSVKAVTGKPIKFVGVGETLDAIEEFHPERMAGRILNMGDVVGLVEKAQQMVEQDDAEALAKKIKKNQLTLDDFLQQLRQVKKMGSIKDLMDMVPGMSGIQFDTADDELPRVEAIICSMTLEERENPEVIDGSRRRRIAAGSGTQAQEVNQLLKQFKQMKKMMKGMVGAGDKMPGAAGGGLPFGQEGGKPGKTGKTARRFSKKRRGRRKRK